MRVRTALINLELFIHRSAQRIFGNIPFTAISIIFSGFSSRILPSGFPLIPPGNLYDANRFYQFLFACYSYFLRVTTTTKSPTSACGVYSGLCLPRKRSAISVAIRPNVLPWHRLPTRFCLCLCSKNLVSPSTLSNPLLGQNRSNNP